MLTKPKTEIGAFHAEHFSGAAVELFTRDFFRPQAINEEKEYHGEYDGYEDYEEEEDDLGYYPDGVKRTLTDEQIAIFRHSELEALRRAEENAAKNGGTSNSNLEARGTPSTTSFDVSEGEEVELESEMPKPAPSQVTSAALKKKRKKGKNKRNNTSAEAHALQKGEKGWFRKAIKPDLRKRTWDVVDAGMDSLDYDGVEASVGAESGSATQRRKISYDD